MLNKADLFVIYEYLYRICEKIKRKEEQYVKQQYIVDQRREKAKFLNTASTIR